jgi:hypothetical protein
MLKYLGITFLLLLALMLSIMFSSLPPVMAKVPEFVITNEVDDNNDSKNKLVVVSKINLQNISKTGIIKVVGVINGEEFIKNIPIDNLKDSAKKINVKFEMNKNNDLNIAHKPDEFFICAYHITNHNNTNNNNNNYNNNNKSKNMDSISFEEQKSDSGTAPILEYFDCNEGDIQSTTKPTQSSLFKAKSQVYNKTAYHYNMYSKDQQTYFATMDDYDSFSATKLPPDTSSKSYMTSTVTDQDDEINNNINNNKNNNNTSTNKTEYDTIDKPVKVKILVPMEDKKNATKIKIAAMVKGQIKSEIVDVQKEFDKMKGYTIERIFAFDRNTDMGPIQVGDRYHACVIGNDLYPPEGSECEKRLIKNLEKTNSVAAR